jgi:hypothetical protein
MKRMTQQKLDTLRFAGRQPCVRGVHIESRFGVDRSTAYRHLGDLTRDGLLERFDSVSPAGGVFAATRKGLDLAELNLRPAQPDVFHLAHDEAMTEIVCQLEAQHVDVLTERELYAYRRLEEDRRYDFEMYDDAHRRYVAHLPDMVCEIPGADKFIAIEVERRPKNVDRWRAILNAFSQRVDVNGFIGVLYVVDPSARPKRLRELSRETGLDERFRLRFIGDPELLDGLNAIVDCAARSEPKASR